jgi:hypothetical protein
MNFLKKSHLALCIVSCAVIVTMAVYPGKSSYALEDITTTQNAAMLERRISLLEQRLYIIESSISRLQQSVPLQRTPVPQPSVSDQEINQVRADIQKLQLRLGEPECGVLKLDERTAVSDTDTSKSAGAKPADPCRLNPGAPLRLSSRP